MGKYWQKSRLENIGKILTNERNIGKCWQIWEYWQNVDKYWKMLTELKILKKVDKLENVGKILTNWKILEKYWQMSELENIH